MAGDAAAIGVGVVVEGDRASKRVCNGGDVAKPVVVGCKIIAVAVLDFRRRESKGTPQAIADINHELFKNLS